MVPTSSLILREKAKDTAVRPWGWVGTFQLFNQLLVVGDSEFPFFKFPLWKAKFREVLGEAGK